MADPTPTETSPGEAETVCYRHPDRPTRLACSRCGRPICGSCATPAVVGQHCPECVGEARRTAPRVRSTMTAMAPVIVGLVAANAVVFLIQVASGFQFTLRWAMQPIAVAIGEWWRLITATFLHSPRGFLHILLNMAILWMYGPLVEQRFGSVRFLAMYLVSGFSASAVSYAFGPCSTVAVGASGAIFGVVGILLVVLYNRRRSEFVRHYFNGVLTFVAINLVLGFVLSSFIDWRAHVGGLAAGLIIGWGADSAEKPRPVVIQLVVIAAVAAAAIGLVAYRTATISC